jgi:hypothetical protein
MFGNSRLNFPSAINKWRAIFPESKNGVRVRRNHLTLPPIILHLSRFLKLTSSKVLNPDGTKTKRTGALIMGMANTMEIFNELDRRFGDLAQRCASNECIRLIRKLRWIGMDDEAERVLAQLNGWPFRPTETVIAGPWATD